MLTRFILLTVAATVTALLSVPAASAASTCQDSSPAGTYVIRVCIDTPAGGAALSGETTVSATPSVVSGTGPGFQRMVFSLNGQYLLTDYSTPYTFTLNTRRFVDGSYTLAVHALLRDTNSTPDTTVSLTFNNGITTPPVNTKTFTPPQGNPVGPGQTFNVVAAGDGAGGESSESAVTNLMATMNPNLTLYLGDVYEKGTPTEFDNWYGLNQPGNTFFGRFRDITLPTVGNHEYTAGEAPGYFDYWDNTPHYYSVNRHGWHIISLDANSAFNQTAVGTAQYTWLQNDLKNNTQPCTLAFYHQPRYNIGDEGPSTYLDAMWSLMASKGVDLVINGHDHSYQRYVPLDGAGNPSPSGVTEIINGAGGHALGAFPGSDPNLAASAQQFGALKLGLNSAGAAYQFVNTSGSVVDSGSTKCNTSTIDTTSPAAITDLVATSTYKTKIDLTWTPPTDNVGVTRYRIFRDGSLLDTIAAASTYSDTTVTPGSSHSYTVRALDDAGNVAAASNIASATTPNVSVLFHDGFESGDMSNWTNPGGNGGVPNSGLSVQSTDVFAGTYAAKSLAAVAGANGASAWRTLSQPESNLYYVARFKANSHNTSVNLMRMRNGLAASSPVVSLGLSTTNKLTLRNDSAVTPATITSATTATPGSWHTVQVHATVGAAGSTEVWLDGTKVPDLSLATVDLGANPVAKVELGDPGGTTKAFDVSFDEVAVDREFIGDLLAPSAPTNLTATVHSGQAVDLAWTAATDDVGVSGYDVYRNGSLLTSINPATSYRDSTVSSNTGYTYKLVARDAAGNSSGFSNSTTVQTSDMFSDGFESGDLSRWTTVSGLTVSQQQVDSGTWAARATSDGTAGASAQVTLDSGVDDGYYRVRFNQLARGANNVNLLRLRNATNGAMVTAFISSTGKLGYRNDLSGLSTTSATTVTGTAWHELQMHVVDGDSGLVEMWLDGVQVTTQAEPLGTNPVRRVDIGDPSTGRTFDIALDNVIVSPAFVTDAQAPTAPVNLRVTGKTTSSVDLAWDAATDDVGVTGYRVYRNGAGIADLDGSTGTYTDATAADSTAYTYRVTALDAVGHESTASNSVSVTTVDGTKPTAPTNLTASAVAGQNKVNLAWSAATDNTGVTGYNVYRDDLTNPLATLGSSLSFTDTTVASGTAYTYRVTALDASANESATSAPATVTTGDTVAPTAPGGVTATAASDVSATVTWTAATDAGGIAGYDVYRNGAATPVGSVSGSTLIYTNTGLTADTAYTYTVKARDAAGNVSPASAVASATTWLFGDGFETGNFSRWSTSTGIAVTNAQKFSGTYGAEATHTGNGNGNSTEFATKSLPSTYTDLTFDIRFKLLGNKFVNTDILRFRTTTGANILALYYTNNRMLAYQNDVRNTSTVSTTAIPAGVWQEAKVRVRISGTTSQVDVWLNGSPVAALTKVDNLGTNAVKQIVAGESTSGRAYDFAVDDIRVTRLP